MGGNNKVVENKLSIILDLTHKRDLKYPIKQIHISVQKTFSSRVDFPLINLDGNLLLIKIL